MRSYKKTILLLALLTVLGITVTASLQSTARNDSDSTKQEEATPVQEGVMTEKQKQHGKLFKHTGPRLRALVTEQTGVIEVAQDAPDLFILPESGPKPPVLQSAVCNANAVVVGTLNSKNSQLTEQGNFIFTDYEMAVEEVIKNNSAAPIALNNTITVTRAGGVVQLNGRVIRAKVEDFKPMAVGQRYLLFLRFIPATGSYLAYGNGSFQLEGKKVIALGMAASKELLNDGSKDATTFLSETRSFAIRHCEQDQTR